MEADNLISADELERIRKGENPRASTPTPAAPASSTPAPAAPASSTPAPAAPATPKAARAPGSSRPDQYAPHQPGGKGKQSKPGIIGRGLNWLDKTAGKVGGALSNFGHQFTTNVTKEKLKMNWTQKGEPSDSDQLADFMKEQGVPEEVISTVYTKMGLPFTMSPAAAAADTNAPTDAGSTARQNGLGLLETEKVQAEAMYQIRTAGNAANLAQQTALAQANASLLAQQNEINLKLAEQNLYLQNSKDLGDSLRDTFKLFGDQLGNIGDSFATISETLAKNAVEQEQYATERLKIEAQLKAARSGNDEEDILATQKKLNDFDKKNTKDNCLSIVSCNCINSYFEFCYGLVIWTKFKDS
jgi:hypothetical protein